MNTVQPFKVIFFQICIRWENKLTKIGQIESSELASEEKTNNCGAGCAALFFYGIGGLVTLASFDGGEFEGIFMGLILIGIGYGIQKASSTK